MKKNIFYILLLLTLFTLVFYKVSYSIKNNMPGGYTGAPGESSCNSCHTNSSMCGSSPTVLIALNTDLKLFTGLNEITTSFEYKADSIYSMTFEILNPNVNGGFSITSLDENNDFVGYFTTNDNNAHVQTVGSRSYICHKNATAVYSWEFEWTSPPTGTGTVTFYANADKADGAIGVCGDTIIPFKIAIQEFIDTIVDTTSTTINVLPFEKEISLLTNPIINNSISISAIVPVPKKYYISVYNLMGKLIAFKEQTLHTGTKTIKLPFYKKGLFLLNISTNKNEKLVYKIINR